MGKRTGKAFVFIIVFITGINLYAGKVDSLTLLLNHTPGRGKLEILSQLVDATLYNNLDTSCYYASMLEKESKRFRNIRYLSLAYRGLGICHFYQNQYYRAEDYIQKAVTLQKESGDTAGLANSYKILTGIYWETERYEQSVEISFDALQLYEATHDTRGIVSSYNNIGLLYKRMDEPEKALTYYRKAVKAADSAKINYNRGNLYNNMGIVFKDLKKYDKALDYYRKALNEFNKDSLLGGIATDYLNMGNIFVYHIYKPDSALYYLNKGLQLSNNTDYTIQTDIYTGLAALYAQKGDTEKNIAFLKKALSLAESYHDADIQKDLHYDLYKSYKKTRNNREALLHLEQYTRIQDTLTLQKARVTLANLESRLENEKNRIIIQKMKEKQRADRQIKILLLLGIFLLIASLLFLIYGYIQARNKSKLKRALLENEKEQLEEALQFKSRQLTSQALMMMKKNRLLNEIVKALSEIKDIPPEAKQRLLRIQKQLKKSIRSEEDWKLFRYYFEEVNPRFFQRLLDINSRITPAELKLAALVKLKFSIKETASLLNISPDSVKTTRSVLRKKLGLQKGDNIYDFLNKAILVNE